MRKRVQAAAAALLACGSRALAYGDASTAAQMPPAIDMVVPARPTPLRVGGRMLVAHELHLTNFAGRPLRVERVRVADARTGRVLLDLSGAELAAALGHVGPTSQDRMVIPPGARVVAYLDAPLGGGRAPAAIRHLVDFSSVGTPSGTIEGAEVALEVRALPVLSPPLRGGPWVAVYEPGLERGHRRVFYAVGGKARIPGRFAIDWMPAGPETGGVGASGLGAEVLAVAAGVVAATRDGVPESAPGAPRPRVGPADATGNYVSIDIGAGRYAFYEHLMPGLPVRSGQRVRRGQVIGRLGSTGQASRPHLHFHLADANSPLGAEGQPYLLTGGRVMGSYGSIAAFEAGRSWLPHLSATTGPSLPKPNAVFVFGSENGRHQ